MKTWMLDVLLSYSPDYKTCFFALLAPFHCETLRYRIISLQILSSVFIFAQLSLAHLFSARESFLRTLHPHNTFFLKLTLPCLFRGLLCQMIKVCIKPIQFKSVFTIGPFQHSKQTQSDQSAFLCTPNEHRPL